MDPDSPAEADTDVSSGSGTPDMRGASVMPIKAAYEKVEADFSKLQKAQLDRELQVSKKLEDLAKSMTKQMEDKTTETLRDMTDKMQGLEQRLARIEAALGISSNGMGGGMGGGMMGMGGMGMNGMGMGGFGGMGMGMNGRGPGAAAAVISAVQTGNLEQLRAMLAQGADPNARDANGSTALHWAAQMNNEMMVRLLLSAGACKNATDAQGRLPFHLATTNPVRGLLCC